MQAMRLAHMPLICLAEYVLPLYFGRNTQLINRSFSSICQCSALA